MINRAFFLCSDQVIQRADLPIPMTTKTVSINDKILNLPYKEAKECLIEKFDIEYLSYHLKMHQGNVSKTAEKCGLDRRSIHRLVNKHNIIYKS
jgi:transcriptional regulator of acetoin/glycerol metabolism